MVALAVENQIMETRSGTGSYTGEINESGQPHGYGTMRYEDAIYEGTWSNGLRHGNGKMTWPGTGMNVTQTYDGLWINDKAETRHGNKHMKAGGKTKRKRRRSKKNKRTKQNRKR